MWSDLDSLFKKLSSSPFRSRFHLKDGDIDFIDSIGLASIEAHARGIVEKNLKVRIPEDGKQTPMKGHPVFIAQHATATCCRSCLGKWHGIPASRDMTDDEVTYAVSVIMAFIKRELPSGYGDGLFD